MDILLFALFNIIAFVFLFLGLTKQDIVSNVSSLAILLIIGFLIVTGNLTYTQTTNGISYITGSNCTVSGDDTNCTYSTNTTAASHQDITLITDNNVQIGLALIYVIFALYLIVGVIVKR